jgi:acetolactate synthase I/II/III large subunit
MNLSDRLFSALALEGVEVAFFVAGGNAMFLNEGLRKSGIKCIPMHHEQAAAMAAEAYSRISNFVGVCVATNGPAVSNLATGLAGAFLDSVPMIAVVGQSKEFLAPGERSTFLRQKGLFELDNLGLLSSVAKGFFTLSAESNPELVVQEAMRLAKEGRPGPVVIEVNLAVQSQSGPALIEPNPAVIPSASAPMGDPEFWKVFSTTFARAERPLILAGNGVIATRSQSILVSMAEAFNVPFVTTQLAKGISPFDCELFVGHVGPRGDRAGNYAVQNADLLVTVGTSLGTQTVGYETTLFAKSSTKFVQDLGGGVSSKHLELGAATYVNQSVPDFLQSLKSSLEGVSSALPANNWRASLNAIKIGSAVIHEPHRRGPDAHNLYDFVHHLSLALAARGEPSRVVTDAGLSFYVMGQAFRLSVGQTFTVSGGLGSMGYALPAGIGQSQVEGDALTVVVTGDGSMQMNVQELASAAALSSHLIVFVINNDGYASIRNTQDSFFGSRVGSSPETGVVMPDWELVAKAYGVSFERIGPQDDLAETLPRVLSGTFPAVIEVVCQSDQVVMPYVPNYVDESGSLRSKPLDEMAPELGLNPTSKILN